MRDKVIFNDDSSGDAFTDLLFNALLGFAFMFFISFALIQKPLEDGNIESKAEFIISVEWDDYHPDDVDLIVELIGGAEGPAKRLVFSALKNKKHVVTANKALIAKHGDELSIIAEKIK